MTPQQLVKVLTPCGKSGKSESDDHYLPAGEYVARKQAGEIQFCAAGGCLIVLCRSCAARVEDEERWWCEVHA